MKFHQDYVKIKSQIQANIQMSSSPGRRKTTEAPLCFFMADGSMEKKNRMAAGLDSTNTCLEVNKSKVSKCTFEYNRNSPVTVHSLHLLRWTWHNQSPALCQRGWREASSNARVMFPRRAALHTPETAAHLQEDEDESQRTPLMDCKLNLCVNSTVRILYRETAAKTLKHICRE